jgi:hypothetical protein
MWHRGARVRPERGAVRRIDALFRAWYWTLTVITATGVALVVWALLQ